MRVEREWTESGKRVEKEMTESGEKVERERGERVERVERVSGDTHGDEASPQTHNHQLPTTTSYQ